LSVVLECIQAHNGSVELVDSGEFSGAHFRIDIPQKSVASAPKMAANA
jgi:signal transduction histidine kinase